jgi:hypothetical protein
MTDQSLMTKLNHNGRYFVVEPAKFDPEKNQNSIALMSRSVFDETSAAEVTDFVLEEGGVADKFGGGDAVVFTCTGTNGTP